MSAWRNSLMESWSERGRDEWPCEVVLNDGRVALSYAVEGGHDRYEGPEVGPGHYELSCLHTPGKATLHTFKGSKILEGFWMEAGQKGMWRITLAE